MSYTSLDVKPCFDLRQRQTDRYNKQRAKRKYKLHFRCLLIWAKSIAQHWSKKVLFLSYLSFKTKKKLGVGWWWWGGLSKNLVKPWA